MPDVDGTPQQLIERILKARRKTTQIRLIFGGIILILFVFYGWRIYGTFKQFDGDAFLKHLNSQAAAKIWPAVSSEFEHLGREVIPVLTQRVGEEISSQWPAFEKAIDQEIQNLGRDLQEKPNQILGSFVAKLEQPTVSAVASRFPEVTGEQQKVLAKRLQDRLQQWSHLQLTSAVEQHVKVMIEIKETIHSLRPAEGNAAQVTSEDLLGGLIEVLDLRMRLSEEAPAQKGGVK